MKIFNIKDCNPIEDACWKLYELFSSENLSISISKIEGKSIPHYHKKMEEIYFILDWEWTIFIDKEEMIIKKWDLIPIPKNKFHHVESKYIEMLVITNPKFDHLDLLK